MSDRSGESVSFCLVVPCYNEDEMLPAFFAAVVPRLSAAMGSSWRIVCVDDGSRDETFSIIAREHLADHRITGIRLSRNFGHQAAVSVGLAFAAGDYVGVIDCDLQDPVDVLVQLYEKAREEHLDVCYGIRASRDAPLFLRMCYSAFYSFAEHMADHHWPRDAGDFCVMSARCHQVLVSLPEHSRMIRGLRSWVGFKQAGFPYDRPARLHGSSKYNLRRLWALAAQGIVAFSNIPLRMASIIGLCMGVFSVIFGILVVINRFFPRFTVLGYWVGQNAGVTSVLCFLALVFSILFTSIGIIGEYLGVLLQEVKQRPTAVVESVLGDVRKNALAAHITHLGEIGVEQPARLRGGR